MNTTPKGDPSWTIPRTHPDRCSTVIRHFWASELLYVPPEPGQQYRHNDAIDALWGLLDTVPEGRGDFEPALSYRA